ncbi:MAG: DUF86 domain-containing protein [Candidatus Aminicenantaceae bacterium]
MPQFDSDRMTKLVSQMRESLGHLNRHKEYQRENFVNDPDKIGSAKYHFIVAIEAAIDMCNHLISRNGYRAPEDYADTFAVLGENGALEKSFVEVLKEMAKFRNRLVHIYWEIDENQVYDILQNRLSDFKQFLDQIAKFLNWPDLT